MHITDRLTMIEWQVMMAFGQGAGNMLASLDALSWLKSSARAQLLANARPTWDANSPSAARWAFIELMRVAGQIAATKAAADDSIQIERRHLEPALEVAVQVCPCFATSQSSV